MAQKRVLLIGTMLVSAAIGVPTMAMLAPGGGVIEGPSAVEPAEPEAAAPEPLDQDALPLPNATLTTTPPQSRHAPGTAGEEVPSHLGETAAPRRITLTPPPREPAIGPAQPAQPGDPQAPQPQPAEEEESVVVPPPTLPSDPDDADTDDHPTPPGGPAQDDHDPSDERDDPADN